jgi:hypothetical protein
MTLVDANGQRTLIMARKRCHRLSGETNYKTNELWVPRNHPTPKGKLVTALGLVRLLVAFNQLTRMHPTSCRCHQNTLFYHPLQA